MGSTYSERRRPSRDTIRTGYMDDDISIPHRGMLQAERRLQETKALLASPGPLESMLKTTTETGDIGLYSIRPSRASSLARTPLHPAVATSSNVLARSMSMNAPDRRHFRDDRRGLPSHRDTTSEIISLYGSNGQRSMPTSFARSPDDPGPRSYSLTSCSSRYMSDQKSTGTWDSRSSGGSGGVLARPRSPYPYHTRLKRPGVRPSSPALTMDGNVDYSRMVEVDRPSYRTIHRSYGRSYPPMPQRHPQPYPRHRPYPPRSLPGDRDTHELTRHASAAGYARPPWISHGLDQVENNPSVHSPGVSSITSIVRMYASSAGPSIVRQPPISPSGSFYYDYSEDFQEHSVPVSCEPFVPMLVQMHGMRQLPMPGANFQPTGSANGQPNGTAAPRPTSVAQSSFGNSHEEPENPQPRNQDDNTTGKDATATSTKTTSPPGTPYDGDHDLSQDPTSNRRNTGSFVILTKGGQPSKASTPVSDENSLNAPNASQTSHDQKSKTQQSGGNTISGSGTGTAPPHLASDHSSIDEHRVSQADKDTAPETPSVIADSGLSHGSESTGRSTDDPATPSSAARRRSNVYSLQPGLMDLKSFVQDLDDAGLLHDADVSGNLDSSQSSTSLTGPNAGANVHAVLFGTNKVLEAEHDKINNRRHMQDSAVSSVITRLKTDADASRRQSTNDSNSVILAPKPVSPARQLRLRSSVSKLMKALPPVPPTASTKKQEQALAERRLHEPPAPPRISLSGSGNPSRLLYEHAQGYSDRAKQQSTETLSYVGSSTCSASISPLGDSQSSRHVYGAIWDTHFGRHDDAVGGVATGRATKSGSTVGAETFKGAERSSNNHPGPETGPKQLQPLFRGASLCHSSAAVSNPIVREAPAFPNLNLQPSQPRAASLDSSRGTIQKPPVPPKHNTLVGSRVLTDQGLKPQRGLKKRLSDFRIRMTESRHRTGNWLLPDIVDERDCEIIALAVPVTSSTGSPESGVGTSNSNSGADEASRGLRYKLSRWMKSAKNAVNCKRLSTSTAGTSLDTDF